MPSSCKTFAMSFVLMPQLLATFFAHRLCTLSLQTAHKQMLMKICHFYSEIYRHKLQHTIHGHAHLGLVKGQTTPLFSIAVNLIQMSQ